MKVLGLVARPAGVVTTTGPLEAPTGTTTTTLPAPAFETKAGTPLIVTWVAALRCLPQIATRDPTEPDRGVTCTILGALVAPAWAWWAAGATDVFGVVAGVVPAPGVAVVVLVPEMAWVPGATVVVGPASSVVGVDGEPSVRGTLGGATGLTGPPCRVGRHWRRSSNQRWTCRRS